MSFKEASAHSFVNNDSASTHNSIALSFSTQVTVTLNF